MEPMPFDGGKSCKSVEMPLDTPSLKELYAPYCFSDVGFSRALDVDPGRVRYEPFFLKMYGDCSMGETAKNPLQPVSLLPSFSGYYSTKTLMQSARLLQQICTSTRDVRFKIE